MKIDEPARMEDPSNPVAVQPQWLAENSRNGLWRWFRCPDAVRSQSREDLFNLGIIAGSIYILLIMALGAMVLIREATGHASVPFYILVLVVLFWVVLLWLFSWSRMQAGRILAIEVDGSSRLLRLESLGWHARMRCCSWPLEQLETIRAVVVRPGWGQDDGCLLFVIAGESVRVRMDVPSLRRCVSELRRVLPEWTRKLELESRFPSEEISV